MELCFHSFFIEVGFLGHQVPRTYFLSKKNIDPTPTVSDLTMSLLSRAEVSISHPEPMRIKLRIIYLQSAYPGHQ